MNYHKFSDMDERCVGLQYTRNMTEWFVLGLGLYIYTNCNMSNEGIYCTEKFYEKVAWETICTI